MLSSSLILRLIVSSIEYGSLYDLFGEAPGLRAWDVPLCNNSNHIRRLGTGRPHRHYPTDVIDQANAVLWGWNQIGSTVTFGTLNIIQLTTDVNAYAPLEAEIGKLEILLNEKRMQRDALSLAVWDKVKRVRSSVRGIYGDDSAQYEHVGGTRMSERKPRSRKAVVTE